MAIRHRTRTTLKNSATAAPASQSAAELLSQPSPERVPRTRTSAAWIGICATAVSSVALIVFMLQNTRSVEVTFLWMNGSLPLALALLIAGVGMALLAMTIGVARMTQLRRLVHRRGADRTQ